MTRPAVEGEGRWTIYVCPDCDAWSDNTGNGFPLHSACENLGHPEANPVEVVPAAVAERLTEALRKIGRARTAVSMRDIAREALRVEGGSA